MTVEHGKAKRNPTKGECVAAGRLLKVSLAQIPELAKQERAWRKAPIGELWERFMNEVYEIEADMESGMATPQGIGRVGGMLTLVLTKVKAKA